MSRKYLLLILLCISCSIHTIAQTDYYYYKGYKIPLTLNDNKVIISILKEYSNTIESIYANAQILGTIRDSDFDILIVGRSDYEKLTTLDFWEEATKSVIITSSYFTENNDEVFVTPYLNVRLKKEEDTNLLTSYAEEYGLQIIRNMSLMPLWYILAITQNCEKNTLTCANELFESGYFAESVPDMVSFNDLDHTAVSAITIQSPTESSPLYDLQGRRMKDQTTKGIYIKNGRKVVVK